MLGSEKSPLAVQSVIGECTMWAGGTRVKVVESTVCTCGSTVCTCGSTVCTCGRLCRGFDVYYIFVV